MEIRKSFRTGLGRDEAVEVTPGAIRLRKRYLDPHERKRRSKVRDAV